MPTVRGCNLPDDLLYDVENHTWFTEVGDGTVRIGMTTIATAMAGVELARPLTHDLLVSVLNEVGTYVRKVTITDLIDGTFYAEITLVDDQGHKVEVDARPSDGIALALRTGASLYASEAVLVEAGSMLDAEERSSDAAVGEPAEAPKRVGPAAVVDAAAR